MEIRNVLLRKEYYEGFHDKYEETVSIQYTDGVWKAAQLKLIEWLSSSCPHAADDMGYICTQYARFNCPQCMAELKKQLREGNR